MPHDRCCRCHTILTSEDKYHYGQNCELMSYPNGLMGEDDE